MPKLLAKVVDRYETRKEISCKYADQLRYSVRRFERFLGRAATEKDLRKKSVNQWLKHERDTAELSDRSRANLRKTMISVWKSSGRKIKSSQIRKVKVQPKNPEAWTYEELLKVTEAASKLPGVLSNGITRGSLLSTTLWFAYETGLRRRDIWDFDVTVFAGGHTAAVTQHKVRRVHMVMITDPTAVDVQRIADQLKASDDPNWRYALRWPQSERQFYYWMRRARELADVDAHVRNRALQHMRRTGATAIELDGGKAWKFLGHSEPGLDRASYVDGVKTTQPLCPSRNRTNG